MSKPFKLVLCVLSGSIAYYFDAIGMVWLVLFGFMGFYLDLWARYACPTTHPVPEIMSRLTAHGPNGQDLNVLAPKNHKYVTNKLLWNL